MFQVSPGVVVREFEVSTIVPAVDASVGAYAGVFRWGPIGKRVLVDSEAALAARFGRPTNFNAEGWFSAASFLSYSDKLYVSRAADTTSSNGQVGALTAMANTVSVSNVLLNIVKNEDDYETKQGTFPTGVLYLAKYPGAMGNSLRISVVDAAEQFSSNIDLATLGGTLSIDVGSSFAEVLIEAASNTAAEDAAANLVAQIHEHDLIQLGNTSIGRQYLKVTSTSIGDVSGDGDSGEITVTISFDDEFKLSTDFTTTSQITRRWEFWDVVSGAPGQSAWVAENGNTAAQDELHVVVVDEGGKFTGVPGTILEVYQGLSRATDARSGDNLSNYYKDVINTRSQYVWWAADRSSAPSASADLVASSLEPEALDIRFNGGADGADEENASVAVLATAYDLFKDGSDISDVGLILMGKARGGSHGGQMANYVIDNICETRKDCVAFISPDRADVVNNVGGEAEDVVVFRRSLRSTSYAFLDSGYKYMYDRYNDVYRYVPLNGDMAGLAARTDASNDAWWSPAGFNRGHVKNLVRLAWNPNKAERDELYKSGVNPVVTVDGQGTVLLGDKTLLAKPSAFDRINVRRLFIVLEKAIATAAKFSLFEFNDEFTRAQFRNMVNPYLRDVKGRRGVTDFLVVCDETNNTGQVIDRNEFVGSIFLRPNKSINYVTLNFVAVGSDVSFTEAVGMV